MSRRKILIRNGLCVLDDGTWKKDILICGEKIETVFPESPDNPAADADEIIEAEGKLVMSGGIDPHVHFSLPLPGGIHSADDFKSGSAAALAGGTTSIIDFITPAPEESLDAASEKRLKEAESCLCDYSLHFSIVKGMKDIKNQLKTCSERYGIRSCKIYLAYQDTIGLKDDAAFEVFKAASELGIKLLVHCEWGEAVDFQRKEFLRQGKTEALYHAASRPVWTEQAAIAKACKMAELCGTELYAVHVSTAEGIGEIMKARQRGVKVNAEVCLHHLLLDDSRYTKNDKKAPLYIMTPPLRPAIQKKALWKFAKAWIIGNISTDHCPFMKAEKLKPDNFGSVPNGVNGVEERVLLFLNEAVNVQGFSLAQASGLLSGNAADFFRLKGKSGRIEEGSDADLAIIDINKETEISAGLHHSCSDYNCYEGFKTDFGIADVFRRGEHIVNNGELTKTAGRGEFLVRSLD